ncbi:hypothetical protein [Providencia sp. PROV216]|uniref:hypothetical protein n=1 Tax=Providencia sp. PROV216 TaxID=2949912 RepID=UPI00234B1344|nr:hypothetical protein [Providencia sp. PROV216]
MRKYIPLIPTLFIIIYSLVIFFDTGVGNYISVVIINTYISLHGFKLFFTLMPFLSNKDYEYTFEGFEKLLIPLDEWIYRTVILLTAIGVIILFITSQWVVVPFFVFWCFWQGLARGVLLSAVKAASK